MPYTCKIHGYHNVGDKCPICFFYENTTTPPYELDKEAQYDWEKEFYRRMEINGYKRAEYIPEISDSVELFREFIQLGYFATPTSNKR